MMDRKILVAYFSAGGTTKKAASLLAKAANADLFEIQPKTPYTSADLDWTNKRSRSSLEMNDPASRPEIRGHIADMGAPVSVYDVIFLGFPVWWYTAPTIVKTFLEAHDFAGKTIVLFATSGGSGLGATESALKPCAPNAVWKGGKLVNGMTENALKSWVESLHL